MRVDYDQDPAATLKRVLLDGVEQLGWSAYDVDEGWIERVSLIDPSLPPSPDNHQQTADGSPRYKRVRGVVEVVGR